MHAFTRLATHVLLAAAVIAVPPAAHAGESPAPAGLGPEWRAIAHERLDGMRGGFQLPSGLVLSFGVERAVWVNGALVASTRVQINDIAQMTPQQAEQLLAFQQGMGIQVGGGNVLVAPGGGALVIQNTRDNQAIRALTTLSVDVGTLGTFQQLNAHDALQAAVLAGIGGP